MGAMRAAALALLLLGPPRDGPPALRVDGLRLVDAAGRDVLLRGASIADPHPLGKDFRKDRFEILAREWKVNCVRVPVHPGYWKARGADHYDKLLDQAVDWGRELGLYVIIDYHAIGNPKTGKAQKDKPEYDSSMDLARKFWKHVPTRYKDNPWVLYEVFNEPMGIAWKDLRPLEAELVGIIREAAPDSVVIVSSPDWTYDLRGAAAEPHEAKNLLYAWHAYPNRGVSWDDYVGAALRKFPLIATEWGFNLFGDNTTRGNTEDFALPLLRMMEERRIHWTAWCWHPTWDPPLLEGWEKVTPFGRIVRAWLGGERPEPRPPFKEANDFTVWLRKADLAALGASKFDLCVIDPAKDAKEISRNDIEVLKWSGGGPKRVLAWLSAGEAEDHQPYFPKDTKTAWLGPPDPERRTRFKVRYWEEGWQKIVFEALDKVVAQGFDGVYLAAVDGYLHWEKKEKDERARPRMAGLVARISDHAKRRKKGFVVVAQNGEALLQNEGFLNAIDGIAREDIYFARGQQKRAADMIETEKALAQAVQSGKKVFDLEYLEDPQWVGWVYDRARSRGFVPYVTTRDLDSLTIHKGQEPD